MLGIRRAHPGTVRVVGTTAVVAMLVAACGTTPPEERQSLPGAGTADVTVAPHGDMAHLSAVRLAPRAGNDRLVMEFTDRVPGYTVGYVDLPARADASGAEIPLPEARAVVQITLNPATWNGWGGGVRTYTGPADVKGPGTSAVTEAKAAGDFEAVLTWVVGLRGKVPFRVQAFDTPPSLVIDFQS
ncbi:MAG: AMIN-like domain-containing (lipo)protein [Mycobacterium sp.]